MRCKLEKDVKVKQARKELKGVKNENEAVAICQKLKLSDLGHLLSGTRKFPAVQKALAKPGSLGCENAMSFIVSKVADLSLARELVRDFLNVRGIEKH